MALEEPFFANVPVEKPIFILGAARSATTNLHECLYNKEFVSSTRSIDVPLMSYIMKYLFRSLFSKLFSSMYSTDYDSPAHRITAESLAELHHFLFYKRKCEYYITFPHCPLSGTGKLTKDDMLFLKRVIQRQLIWDDKSLFIGKSVVLIPYIDLIRDVFPDARIIICRRDMRQALESTVGLLQNFPIIQRAGTQLANELTKRYIEEVSVPTMIKLKKNDIVCKYTVDFEQWKKNPTGVLEDISRILQLPYVPTHASPSEKRSIRIHSEEMNRYISDVIHVIDTNK